MSPTETKTEAPVTEAKAKKPVARDQGVPEVYLSEAGTFRPGYDAKMKSDLITAILGSPVLYQWDAETALRVMTERRVRHVVVMHDRKMVGIVSIGDLVKFRLKDAELENQVLRDLALRRMAVE
jgi:predicted transcriptional regulator